MRVGGFHDRLDPEEKQRIREMVTKGLTDRQIGQALRRSPRGIEKARKRMRIIKPRPIQCERKQHAPAPSPIMATGEITRKVAAKLREDGYDVMIDRPLAGGIARPDVRATKLDCEILVEVKELREACNHVIITGAGQLLFYHYIRPNADLLLAVPRGSVKASKTTLGFLGFHGISLAQF